MRSLKRDHPNLPTLLALLVLLSSLTIGLWGDIGQAQTNPVTVRSAPSVIPNWNDITNIPAGFADGIDNTGSGGSALATQTDGIEQEADTTIYDWATADFNLFESPASDFDITINDGGIDHDATTNFLAAEHIDWALTTQGTIHATNYVDVNTNAGTICTGTTTYLDGEGTCDTLNAGTDITADLEEETHVTEHAENGADELLAETLGTACTENQILKADATGGMNCAADAGGASLILDLGDDAANESTGLGEIATTGDTNSIFTESAADKLLIAVGSNWPTADNATTATTATTANAVAANSVALTTDTTGNYAAGDAEAGAALTGDSATAFFTTGEIANAQVADDLTIAGGVINTSALTLTQSANPTPTAEGVIEWETDTNEIHVGDAVGTQVFVAGAHTTDTGPSPDCSGATTYQNGEASCVDISVVYEPIDANITKDNEAETISGAWIFTASIEVPNSATLPATCTIGDTYWDTDADTDGSLYVCRATDTWKEVDDDGGAGGGDITDVFNCATGDCSSITIAATDLLNLSGSDASTATEGLILPQHATACAGGTAEGQVCWEADANALWIGNGATLTQIGAGGAEINDLEGTAPTAILDTEIYIGTGAGTGAFAVLSGDATMANTGAVTIAANSVALTTDTTGNYAAGDAEAGNATGVACTDCIALTTETSGNYAAGDAEAGAALTGDSATSFFSSGTIADAQIADTLTVDASSTVDSITATNLVDKSATEAITGDWDFGGGGIEIENGITPPACTVGQLFVDTDATAGQQLMACEAGTFVKQGDGGGAGSTVVIKASTESVSSSTVLQNDDELTFTPAANTKYGVHGMLVFSSASATPDAKLAFDIPTSATMAIGGMSVSVTSIREVHYQTIDVTASDEITIVTAEPTIVLLDGSITVGSTATAIVLQWAQNTSNATSTDLLLGSTLTFTAQ